MKDFITLFCARVCYQATQLGSKAPSIVQPRIITGVITRCGQAMSKFAPSSTSIHAKLNGPVTCTKQKLTETKTLMS